MVPCDIVTSPIWKLNSTLRHKRDQTIFWSEIVNFRKEIKIGNTRSFDRPELRTTEPVDRSGTNTTGLAIPLGHHSQTNFERISPISELLNLLEARILMLTSLQGEPAEQSVCTMLWSITSGLANHPSCQSYCSLSLARHWHRSGTGRPLHCYKHRIFLPTYFKNMQTGRSWMLLCYDFFFSVGCFLLTGWVPPTYFVLWNYLSPDVVIHRRDSGILMLRK